MTEASYAGVFRAANNLSVNKLAAARMRIRYLDEEVSHCLQFSSPEALYWACEALEEILWLLPRARYELENRKAPDAINDEMIAAAKQFPITNLIQFKNRWAAAFCHEDSKPSLYHYPKQNKAQCFVCGKSFNPVDVLMHQGYSFKEAVRRLCGN